jgi:signal transduction histidine kinase
MAKVDAASPTPAKAFRPPKWVRLYFVLALLDLSTVTGSLLLNYHTTASFNDSVQVNRVWARRIWAYENLAKLAEDVNAPGNNVFDNRNVPRESQSMRAARKTFDQALARARHEMMANGPSVLGPWLRDMDDVERAMDEMCKEADLIFANFTHHRPDLAGERMAEMDRRFAALNEAIRDLSQNAGEVQQNYLARQSISVEQTGRFEWIIAGLIFLMVGGVMIYGHQLSRRLSAEERAQEDTHALLAKQQAELLATHAQLEDHSQQIEAEVARRTEELQTANTELARLSLVKDEFLSVVSHELRTPIHYVKGFAGLLGTEANGPLNADQRQYTESIVLASRRMLALVDDLLDSATIQAGQLRLRFEATDFTELAHEVIASIEPLARTQFLELEVDIQCQELIDLDRQRVGQVLTNLLANAIKFTAPGGRVALRAHCAGESLVTEVIDNGIGIAPTDLPQLFMRFSQLDMGVRRKAGGTGLGLSISKALVEGHGGVIEVESQPGRGSTFRFTLPLCSRRVARALETV